MFILSWILPGLIAGLLGSKIVIARDEGMLLNVVLGIFGGISGGYLFSILATDRDTRTDLFSVGAATAGAILVIAIYHSIRRIAAQRR